MKQSGSNKNVAVGRALLRHKQHNYAMTKSNANKFYSDQEFGDDDFFAEHASQMSQDAAATVNDCKSTLHEKQTAKRSPDVLATGDGSNGQNVSQNANTLAMEAEALAMAKAPGMWKDGAAEPEGSGSAAAALGMERPGSRSQAWR